MRLSYNQVFRIQNILYVYGDDDGIGFLILNKKLYESERIVAFFIW